MLAGLHVPLLLLVGACLVLICSLSHPSRSVARAGVCLAAFVAMAIYYDWRIDHLDELIALPLSEAIWPWTFFALEVLLNFELALFLLIMSRTTNHSPLADRYERELRAQPKAALPQVDVWIATYNEDWSILEKTIIGALNLDYPKENLRIWVLDDGRRDWLAERCKELGVDYVTRPNNKGNKAGNHNQALTATSAPFILSLDADFVPFPNFIYRTLGFFHDEKVAIVQTPQSFYNEDAMRKGLRLRQGAPDELGLFYREVQPARDAWNAAFYCGSCAMLRRSAIEAIGGFETATHIEDQATSVKLLTRGYVTRYLNEQLSIGLSAETLAVVHDQRNRWCRGGLQILFLPYGPILGRGLNLVQRVCFLQTYWITTTLTTIGFAMTPFLFWAFGLSVFPLSDIVSSDILAIPIEVFVIYTVMGGWITRLHWLPVATPAWQLFLSIELLPTVISTLLKPFGTALIRVSRVTAKGSLAVVRRVDVPTLTALLLLIVATTASFLVSLALQGIEVRRVDTLAASVFWTVYTLLVLTAAALICFERPYRRVEERFLINRPARLSAGGQSTIVVIRDASLGGANVVASNGDLPTKTDLILDLPEVGEIPATLVRRRGSTFALQFLEPTTDMRHRLIRYMYTNRTFHQPAELFRFGRVAGALWRRFATAG